MVGPSFHIHMNIEPNGIQTCRMGEPQYRRGCAWRGVPGNDLLLPYSRAQHYDSTHQFNRWSCETALQADPSRKAVSSATIPVAITGTRTGTQETSGTATYLTDCQPQISRSPFIILSVTCRSISKTSRVTSSATPATSRDVGASSQRSLTGRHST